MCVAVTQDMCGDVHASLCLYFVSCVLMGMLPYLFIRYDACVLMRMLSRVLWGMCCYHVRSCACT